MALSEMLDTFAFDKVGRFSCSNDTTSDFCFHERICAGSKSRRSDRARFQSSIHVRALKDLIGIDIGNIGKQNVKL